MREVIEMRKKMMTKIKRWAAALVFSCGIFGSLPVAQAATVDVTPTKVPITLTYHGAQLTVSGQSAPEDHLILKISSESHDTAMKNYEKVGGMVWMKTGTLEFKGVPGVYLIHSTADLSRILPETERGQYQLGYEAMAKATRIEDKNGNPVDGKWFDEFVRFKEKEKVYKIEQGTIVRQHGENSNAFKVVVDWPFQAPPGEYKVELFAVKDGKVVDKAATQFEVERVGIVAMLSKMATEQSALYGAMSVVMALVAGLAVGAIFKKGGGSH